MIVTPYIGAMALLDFLTDELGTWIHLYTNDLTPYAGTVLTDFVEASFPGYAPVQVKTWSVAMLQDGRAVTVSDPRTWTLPSAIPAVEVFGYFVTQGKSGALLWVERRTAGPIIMQNAGDQATVIPRLTLRGDPDSG